MDQTMTTDRFELANSQNMGSGFNGNMKEIGSGPNHPLTNVSWFNMTISGAMHHLKWKVLLPFTMDPNGVSGTAMEPDYDKTDDIAYPRKRNGPKMKFNIDFRGNTISFHQANDPPMAFTYGDLENGAGETQFIPFCSCRQFSRQMDME